MFNRLHNKQFKSDKKESVAIVLHVITEPDDIYLPEYSVDTEELDPKNLNYVGGAVIRKTWEVGSHKPNTILRPFDRNNLDLPIEGETVKMIVMGEGRYYQRIPGTNLNLGNARLNQDLITNPYEENSNDSGNYNVNNKTQTPNASSNNQSRTTSFGTYFTENQVNELKPEEGDKIIQSRFGQSMRFSAYNNPNRIFSPTIIIRNGQGVVPEKTNSKINEDINLDGSTILFGSNEYQSNFSATTIQQISKFEGYPSTLNGNQLILNSDRIILSAKASNMIFHSRGNYGFISDGKFSIDNGLGADLDFGGDVNITTDRSNSNFSINAGSGKIFLNTDTNGRSPNTSDVEPLVRGNILKQILEAMIDLINEQVYKTPSGPTAIGPENKVEFNDLKSRLSDMLSTQNFTE